MTDTLPEDDILAQIGRLSSAEDIFAYLALPYEPAVLNVARLHIMKRFGSYLSQAEFTGMDAPDIRMACRETLARAYGDFVESTPLKEKVFKVFKDEEAKQKARFVGIESLTLAPKAG
ncbi:nitrogenase stabilizing/protective protein NifW [Pseudooceanicola nanhaiensis]|uniref:nitrogenase stabilizing/protective protein NifW n=1 Tax=Pseudooceanicola nanhaiensis TaxID=375761 RepID=UPI001CD7DAFC|nr:nitrogenase stabilizing/protective protein NifW [Pseudooceanicola nanhaiensis]MCA0920168.1 nitrogenase stabilizing/protective protein NifW [Pseudooceanicola nanhaiensis]